jgi:flagellar biosynthesis/type III secretory pathway protein FliH
MSPSNKKKSKARPTKQASITSSSPPPSTDPLPTDYTADFAAFIRLADLSDIQHFCEAASSSREGINLGVFWQRAFAEGQKVRQEEEYERGFASGYNDGYTDACEKDYEATLALYTKVSTTEIGTQADFLPCPTPCSNVSVQTIVDTPIFSDEGTQTVELMPLHTAPTNSTPACATCATSAVTNNPAVWPTPPPASFTICYTPLAISYPDAPNPAARLPTDAVRVTRNELALMLRQSYIHGSEHGWKANVTLAKERLQTDYEKDMQTAATDFAEHETRIREEEFNRGFDTGREAGIQGEVERRESGRALQNDFGMQTEPEELTANNSTTPPRLDASIQATEPPPSPSPIPDHTPSVAISSSPVPLNWADDAASLPTKILPSPLPPRDLSDLRSSKSNPFSSLQRRSKNQSSRARQSRRPHSHFNFNSFNSRHHISFTPSRSHSHTKTYPHLNWESDPRLFDLSRSLKALGWIRAY